MSILRPLSGKTLLDSGHQAMGQMYTVSSWVRCEYLGPALEAVDRGQEGLEVMVTGKEKRQ